MKSVIDSNKVTTLFSNKIKLLSFILAIFVVFIHAYNITDNSSSKLTDYIVLIVEHSISQGLSASAVPLFFFISAFLFYRNYNLSVTFKKIQSRFRSLVIPYMVWNAIYMFVYYILSKNGLVNRRSFSLTFQVIIKGIFLYDYNGVFWFLFSLIVMVLVSPLLYILMKRRVIATVIIVITFILSYFGLETHYFKISSLLYYLLGVYSAIFAQDTMMVVNVKRGIIGNIIVLISISIIVIDLLLLSNSIISNSGLQLLFILIISYGVYLSVDLFVNTEELPKWLSYSFAIYCLQELVLETLQRMFSFVVPHWLLIDYLISPMLTVSIIVFFTSRLHKVLPSIYSLVFGNRE